jgi:hypothetical protein
MSDDPKDVIEFAIRSAFLNYPKEGDPNWRSPHWIEPKECAHLAMAVKLELQAKIPDREELTPILSAYSTALPFINFGDAVVQSKRIASFKPNRPMNRPAMTQRGLWISFGWWQVAARYICAEIGVFRLGVHHPRRRRVRPPSCSVRSTVQIGSVHVGFQADINSAHRLTYINAAMLRTQTVVASEAQSHPAACHQLSEV